MQESSRHTVLALKLFFTPVPFIFLGVLFFLTGIKTWGSMSASSPSRQNFTTIKRRGKIGFEQGDREILPFGAACVMWQTKWDMHYTPCHPLFSDEVSEGEKFSELLKVREWRNQDSGSVCFEHSFHVFMIPLNQGLCELFWHTKREGIVKRVVNFSNC